MSMGEAWLHPEQIHYGLSIWLSYTGNVYTYIHKQSNATYMSLDFGGRSCKWSEPMQTWKLHKERVRILS